MKAPLAMSLLLTALAAAPATHAAAPAIAPPGIATLEALLACKAGSDFSAADAIDALQAAGLAKKPGGTFDDCITTRDTSNLDPGLNERKTYCRGVGVVLVEESDVTEELISYTVP